MPVTALHPHPPTMVLIRNRASGEGSQQLTPGNAPQLLGPGPRCPRKAGGRGPPCLGWYPELSSGAVRKKTQNEHVPVILWVQADAVPQEGPDGKPKG